MIKLSPCFVDGVRADLVKNHVKITLSASLTPELQRAVKHSLGWWAASDQPIAVTMIEYQEKLPGLAVNDESV